MIGQAGAALFNDIIFPCRLENNERFLKRIPGFPLAQASL